MRNALLTLFGHQNLAKGTDHAVHSMSEHSTKYGSPGAECRE